LEHVGTRHRWAWRLVLAGAIVESALVVSGATLAAAGPSPRLRLAAGPPPVPSPQATTPVIDGKIGPVEWVGAGELSLPFKGHPGTLYLEHDARFNYFLLVVRDSCLPASCCKASVYFDNKHNGQLDRGDDAITFTGAGVDRFWDGKAWRDDVSANGKNDVQAAEAFQAATGQVILEGRKPLCSGDRTHDFCTKPGATLGFTVDYTSAGGEYFTYPGDPTDASQFGNLKLLPNPKPPPPPPAPGRPSVAPAAGLVTVQQTSTGTKVDATAGTATVESKSPDGTTQTAQVSQGQFVVTQKKGKALTLLRLSKPIECGRGYGTTRLRRLVVVANGKFRTQGAHGWAMPKGQKAKWRTTDFCVPLKRHLAADTKKKPRRRVVSCYRNLGGNKLGAHDPEHRPPDITVRPGRRRCVYH
jgi:hypothetical protein